MHETKLICRKMTVWCFNFQCLTICGLLAIPNIYCSLLYNSRKYNGLFIGNNLQIYSNYVYWSVGVYIRRISHFYINYLLLLLIVSLKIYFSKDLYVNSQNVITLKKRLWSHIFIGGNRIFYGHFKTFKCTTWQRIFF